MIGSKLCGLNGLHTNKIRQRLKAEVARLKRENEEVLIERKEVTDKKQAAIKEIGEKIDKHERKRILAIRSNT